MCIKSLWLLSLTSSHRKGVLLTQRILVICKYLLAYNFSVSNKVNENYQQIFLSPLISQASVNSGYSLKNVNRYSPCLHGMYSPLWNAYFMIRWNYTKNVALLHYKVERCLFQLNIIYLHHFVGFCLLFLKTIF